MTGPVPYELPERSKVENYHWLETAKNIALLFVMFSVIWVLLSLFWPATFGSLSSEYELAVFLLLVSSALTLACASGFCLVQAVPEPVTTPVARETLISVSLPEMSVHRADPAVPVGQVSAPHTTAPVSDPALALSE